MELNCRRDQKVKAMHDQSDFLKRLVAKLPEASVPLMLVGSVAANYHGHPRSTFDILDDIWERIRDVVFSGDEEETAGDL
jgi:hypothetical protein